MYRSAKGRASSSAATAKGPARAAIPGQRRVGAQGHARAADTYGLILFQSGRREVALPYVEAAARRGDPRSQYLLGVAHFNGDLVAKEVEDGTLRMILSRPITRLRLITVKWVAGVIFAVLLVIVLGGVALAAANIWFPWKSMVVIGPGGWFNLFGPSEGFNSFVQFLTIF